MSMTTLGQVKKTTNTIFTCTLEIIQYALKGQKLLAQGSALGIIAISKAPCKGDKFASIISSCITLLSSNSSCSAKHLK